MSTHKKPTNHAHPIKPKLDEEYMFDNDSKIYETIMFIMTPYKLRQPTYEIFRDNQKRIPTWQSNLANVIVLVTCHFP